MGSVYRNGKPPKKLLHKRVTWFSDMDFKEDNIVAWAKQSLAHLMQYDFVKFNGTKGKLNRSIELTAWFQTKGDAEAFEKEWM
jgi:hypothetical protein